MIPVITHSAAKERSRSHKSEQVKAGCNEGLHFEGSTTGGSVIRGVRAGASGLSDRLGWKVNYSGLFILLPLETASFMADFGPHRSCRNRPRSLMKANGYTWPPSRHQEPSKVNERGEQGKSAACFAVFIVKLCSHWISPRFYSCQARTETRLRKGSTSCSSAIANA